MGRYDVDNLKVFIFKDDPLDDNVDYTAQFPMCFIKILLKLFPMKYNILRNFFLNTTVPGKGTMTKVWLHVSSFPDHQSRNMRERIFNLHCMYLSHDIFVECTNSLSE